MNKPFPALIDYLVEQSLVSSETAEDVLKKTNTPMMALENLIHDYNLNTQLILELCREKFKLTVVDPKKINPQLFVKNILPPLFLKQECVLVVENDSNALLLLTADPFNRTALELLKFKSQRLVEVCLADFKNIKEVLSTWDNQPPLSQKESIEYPEKMEPEWLGADDPLVVFIQTTLIRAYERKASDIHFEPFEKKYRIRYRLDGLLQEVSYPPIHMADRIASRLKIMARCDISEKRLPQDGRFKFNLSSGVDIDCRLSTCPTLHGEKIVLRLLSHTTKKLNIDHLGLLSDQKRTLLSAIEKPQGLILVTGPTGSGKTMSLYTLLDILNTPQKNISTVENPVEIRLDGVNQVNVNPKAKLSFSTVLRAFLRQDPDIMMVGEIRDMETADIALRAAETGHLVFSTLHTNSALEALSRLKNMGLEKYAIINALSLIVAQRLIRKLCDHCKKQRTIEVGTCQTFKLSSDFEGRTHYTPGRCEHCSEGYHGRIGVFEVLPLDKMLIQLFISGADSSRLNEQLAHQKFISLWMAGLEKVMEGITSFSEIRRVIQI